MMSRLSRLARLAPYLLLGPISGFLVYMIKLNIEGDRPLLAALYTVVLCQYTLFLTVFAGKAAVIR
jgi:hypothetical protein